MIKVKAIESDEHLQFERNINSFLRTNPDIKVIDIKITSCIDDMNLYHMALVLYETE